MSAPGMNLLRHLGIGALLLIALAVPAAGQTATTGAVRGTVRSADGEALVDALVTLVESRSGSRHQAVTARNGSWRLVRLPAGEYSAIAEQIGYAPTYLTAVPVRPGTELDVDFRLRPGSPSELSLDSASYVAGAARVGRAAASRWLAGDVLRLLPFGEPDLAEAGRLVTWLDRDLGPEGLPGSFSALSLEGHVFRAAAHPLLAGGATGLLPPNVATALEVNRSTTDAEWLTPAGVAFSALARRGAEQATGELAGQGSAGPLATAGFFDAGSLSPRQLRGEAVIEGAAFGDSARFAVGGFFRSDEVGLSSAWPGGDESAAIAAAGAWIGRLDSNLQPRLLARESFAGFGQLDWRLAAGQRLSVTLAGGKPADQPALANGSGVTWPVEGQDLLAGISLFTELGAAGNQLRLSWGSSTRESLGTTPTAIGITVPGGLRLNGSEAARFEESTIRVLDAIHFRSGSHSFKLGGDLAVTTHDQAWRRGAVAEVLFGGVTQLQQSVGVFSQTRGIAPAASWTGQSLGGFLQDSWRGESGLGITAALRLERHSVSDVPLADADWLRLTGIANDIEAEKSWRFSPRLDVSWATGEQRQFVVNVAGGLFHDRVNPVLVGEWLVDDGTAEVDRAVGNVGVWTVTRPAGATSRNRLTLPNSPLRGPETARASGGFAYDLGGGATLSLDGGFRHTRFLPRRTDLNLLPAERAHDQYGRPVYGTLVQQGGLVTATPGSNRRFPEYDEVAALTLDGWSTWYGGTLRLERNYASGLLLGAGYTFSRTRDNWVGALAGAGVGTAGPVLGQTADWSEGTSDFDVPHRAAVFAAWQSPVVRVSGVFRYEAGRPFTPGFPWGVDANGDGFTGNDPAFVDATMADVNTLVSRWDCLRRSNGRLAERNSCRADATMTVDARAEATILGLAGGGRLAATAELIDLLETDFSPVDAALYRIDPAGTLVHNAAERTVTVPLLANPDFGEPLLRARTGRSVRLGLALTW